MPPADEEMAAHACDAGELNRLYQEKQEVEARLEQEMTAGRSFLCRSRNNTPLKS